MLSRQFSLIGIKGSEFFSLTLITKNYFIRSPPLASFEIQLSTSAGFMSPDLVSTLYNLRFYKIKKGIIVRPFRLDRRHNRGVFGISKSIRFTRSTIA